MKKKLLQILSIAAVAIAAAFTPATASAAVGDKTIGVMGGFASYNDGGFADIYFKYHFAPHVRFAPDLGYVFRSDHKQAFILNADVQLPFTIVKSFEVYPLVGVTYNFWEYQHGGGHLSRAGFNFGAGISFNLTSQISVDAKAKYSLMNDTGGCFVGIGLGYTF